MTSRPYDGMGGIVNPEEGARDPMNRAPVGDAAAVSLERRGMPHVITFRIART